MNVSVTVYKSALLGSIQAIPSKSDLHRALFCAALTQGTSIITPFYQNNDITATLNVLSLIELTYEISNNSITIHSTSRFKNPQHTIDVFNSATTLRLALPIALLCPFPVLFRLGEQLKTRSLKTYYELFKDNLFLEDSLLRTEPTILPNKLNISTPSSSQFMSGLLLAYAKTQKGVTLNIDTTPSKPYIAMTINTLKAFGITMTQSNYQLTLPPHQAFKPTHYIVEGDYSNAAFFLCAKLFHPKLKILGLPIKTVQGDQQILAILNNIKNSNTIDLLDIPDLGPILILTLSMVEGTHTFYNVSRLIDKETNRLKHMLHYLETFNKPYTLFNNTLVIQGNPHLKGNFTLSSYGDHRLAMTLAIAGTLCEGSITILDAYSVDKSYPTFYKDLASLNGNLKIQRRSVNDEENDL